MVIKCLSYAGLRYPLLVSSKDIKTILDVGCGIGKDSIQLALLGFKVTGQDIDKKAIAIAKAIAKSLDVKIKFTAKPLSKIKKRFDCVRGCFVLPFLKDNKERMELVKEIDRLSKKMFLIQYQKELITNSIKFSKKEASLLTSKIEEYCKGKGYKYSIWEESLIVLRNTWVKLPSICIAAEKKS